MKDGFFFGFQINGKTIVRLGKGDGSFLGPVTYSSGGVFPTSVAISDFNKDGKNDFLVANTCSGATDCINTADDGAVSVFMEQGTSHIQSCPGLWFV